MLPHILQDQGPTPGSHGIHHLHTLPRLYRQQDPDVREAVAPYIRSEAWWAHSEPLITSLMYSSNVAKREFAVAQIRRVRESAKGRKRVRKREVPSTFNLEATSFTELIDWEMEQVTERVFTSSLPLEDVMYRASVFLPLWLQTKPATLSPARGQSSR